MDAVLNMYNEDIDQQIVIIMAIKRCNSKHLMVLYHYRDGTNIEEVKTMLRK